MGGRTTISTRFQPIHNSRHEAARHLVVDERFPQPTALKRLRRRGPKSIASIQRRFVRHGQLGRRLPQGDGLCESSPSSPFALTSFTTLQHNMRGFVSHRAEFEAHLQLLGNPIFVGLTGTLLNPSVKSPSLSGYSLISRLDRRDGRQGGGIAFYALNSAVNSIVHVGDSPDYERS